MVSDGSRIYFTEFRNFIFHPIQIMRQGGESRPLVGLDTGQQYQIGAITRDGSYLVLNPFFGIGGGMWLAPTMGGALRRFGQVEGNAVGFSRDGKTVVYSNGVLTSDIFVANADGSAPRKLLTAPGRFYWPEFSPDDRRIRLTSFDYGKTGLPTLWEMSADGTGLHPLLPGWTDAPSQCCGSWTADGKYYVFQATREGSTHLWALREGRSLFSSAAPKPRQLTSGPMNFIRPLVPPDGKGLYAVGWQLRGELAQFDAASGNFIPHPASVSAEWLAYSRDGQRMAYATYPEAQLWRSKPDGSDRLQLTLPPMRARDPQWSPDGSTIAFEGQVGDKPWKLYVVSSDGGAARALTNEDRLEAFPTWSRDGSQLAFAVVSDAATLFPSQGLRILDMRTRSETEVPQSGGFLAPAWAPDGRSIAAVTGDRKRIMLYDVANRRWTELARPGVDVLGEYWSADGLSLHFHSMPNRIQFFRFDMRKRQLRRLGEIHDRWVFGAGLPWMGVTPEGIPVFLREQSIHQLFALDWER